METWFDLVGFVSFFIQLYQPVMLRDRDDWLCVCTHTEHTGPKSKRPWRNFKTTSKQKRHLWFTKDTRNVFKFTTNDSFWSEGEARARRKRVNGKDPVVSKTEDLVMGQGTMRCVKVARVTDWLAHLGNSCCFYDQFGLKSLGNVSCTLYIQYNASASLLRCTKVYISADGQIDDASMAATITASTFMEFKFRRKFMVEMWRLKRSCLWCAYAL